MSLNESIFESIYESTIFCSVNSHRRSRMAAPVYHIISDLYIYVHVHVLYVLNNIELYVQYLFKILMFHLFILGLQLQLFHEQQQDGIELFAFLCGL